MPDPRKKQVFVAFREDIGDIWGYKDFLRFISYLDSCGEFEARDILVRLYKDPDSYGVNPNELIYDDDLDSMFWWEGMSQKTGYRWEYLHDRLTGRGIVEEVDLPQEIEEWIERMEQRDGERDLRDDL